MLAERIIRGAAVLQLQLVGLRRSEVSVFVRSVYGGRNDRFASGYRFSYGNWPRRCARTFPRK